MPEVKNVPEIPDVDLDAVPLISLQKQLDDALMKTMILRTFDEYQNRRRTHEDRWNMHDKLYYAYVDQEFWPGTNIPKASLGRHLVFEQILTAYSLIAQALFSQPEFFSIEAAYGGDPRAARAQQAHLEYALNTSTSARGSSAENEFMKAILSSLLYGNGGVLVEYNEELQAPDIQWIDTRDVFVDPAASRSSIQSARSIIVRKLMTVSEILKLRGTPKMMIPTEDELYGLSFGYQNRSVDSTKQIQESLRGNYFNPRDGASHPIPDDRQMEVLIYYSATRVGWLLNGKWLLYNEPNIYGKIPLAFMGSYPVPGRFYAMSIADIQMDNQLYMEGLINARLDNVNLANNPPRITQRGGGFMPANQVWGPGTVIQSDDPTNNYVHTTQDVGANIFQDLGYIKEDADRVFGLGGAVSGIPTPSNANRTATGVNAQLQGSSLKLWPLVSSAEIEMIIPAITLAAQMVRMHTNPGSKLPGVLRNPENKSESQPVAVDYQAFMQETKIEIKAASKMLSRDRIMTFFQALSNSLFTSQFQAELNKVGQTLDFKEISECLGDGTGMFKKYKFIRDFTQQELQQIQQQQQQAAQAQQSPQELQLKQIDAQVRTKAIEAKAQTDHEKNIIDAQKNQPNPMEMEMEQMKVRMDMQLKQQEMEFKEKMAMIEARAKEMDLIFKQKEFEQKAIQQQQKTHSDMQMANVKQAMEQQRIAAEAKRDEERHQIEQQRSSEIHEQGIRHSEDSHSVKLSMMKNPTLKTKEKTK